MAGLDASLLVLLYGTILPSEMRLGYLSVILSRLGSKCRGLFNNARDGYARNKIGQIP